MKTVGKSASHLENECVPLEALNILLVLGEVGRDEVLAQTTLIDFCDTIDRMSYFEIVSLLFCLKDEPAFSDLRNELFDRAILILSEGDVQIDSQSAHLALDILCCPYFENAKRSALFKILAQKVGMGPISNARASAAVAAFEQEPWFVNWQHANLLHMIRKKELSAVY